MLKRVGLFLLTNFLVITTISIAYNLFVAFTGINQYGGYYVPLLVFCTFWGFGGAFISLFMSKFIAKHAYNVQIIDPQGPQAIDTNARELVFRVHSLARKAGLQEMPEVGVYDSPEINAFATGPTKNNSLVAVSTGLLQTMSREEVEGVIGHEIAHVANGDMVTMTLVQGIVNASVLFFSRVVAKILSSNVDEKYQGLVQMLLTIVFDILFTILGSIVVSYYSRSREFRADYGGASYAGRSKMIAGLRKLKSQYELIAPEGANDNMATMKISSRQTGLMALFSTHPSLDDRIAALERAQIAG